MKIAIVRLSSLGDIVQSMYVLDLIKRNFNDIEIDWYVDQNFEDIVYLSPCVKEVVGIPLRSLKKNKSIFGLIKLIFTLRKSKKSYDYVFDLQGLIKSAIVAKLINGKKVIGFSRKGLREKNAVFFYDKLVEIEYDVNVYIRYFELINSVFKIDLNPNINQITQYIFPRNKINRFSNKNIGVVMATSKLNKNYPTNLFYKALKNTKFNLHLIWGNNYERLLANDLKELIQNKKNIYILEKRDLIGLVDFIATMDIIISSDTGILHLAPALGIKSIGLFGPTDPDRVFLQTPKNKYIKSPEREMKLIKPEQISNLINELIIL